MLSSLQIVRCSRISYHRPSYSASWNYQCRCRKAVILGGGAGSRHRLSCYCSLSLSVEEEEAPQSESKPIMLTVDDVDGEDEENGDDDNNDGDDRHNKSGRRNVEISGIVVPRQRCISVSKSVLLDAIVSSMFASHEEAAELLSLSRCLDSILHAEHRVILEEMRDDYEMTRLSNSKTDSSQEPADSFMEKQQDDESGNSKPKSSGFSLNLKKMLAYFSSKKGKRNPIKSPRISIPVRFQRSFMKLLYNAEFEELSPRDLLLTSALNTDYLLTLPIYVDWKRISESSAIIFRRGYSTERQRGLLLAEKLDYLQSKLLQKFFLLISKPLGNFGVWLNEAMKSITQEAIEEISPDTYDRWLKEFSSFIKSDSDDDRTSDDLEVLAKDLPIWVAAQKAVDRYEGILSEVGPRERLLRKFLVWTGLGITAPDKEIDLDGSSSNISQHSQTLSRISISDIFKPASSKACGNDFKKMTQTFISILFSKSFVQEPSFQELVLFYIEGTGEQDMRDKAEIPSVQMKIYERIPIPDLLVVFPHKKLSFRILDTVRLDVATILGLLAYFFSYKFQDIRSSPSAFILDVIAATALIIYVSRVFFGYKQTRDRYQLLVNRTLYEKTVASGFGSIHFLIDASEQQQYKEAILVYAILLKAENGQQVSSRRDIADKCETFIYNAFKEKIEMPVDKAVETLLRLGLIVDKTVNGKMMVQAISCNTAYVILRNRWSGLINY